MSDDCAPLTGRTALVTGAAKRLGRAVALALADAGADVCVHYRRSVDEGEKTAAEIRRRGRRAQSLLADLANQSQVGGMVATASSLMGRPVDLLVNNASMFPESHLADVAAEDVQSNVQVHAMAPLELGRTMAARCERGDIVNIIDSRVTDYDHTHVAYHLSKRMLWDLTRMMALEFAPAVRVNAVAPGLILPPEGQDDGYLERLASTNPLQRHGDPEDIVRAVLFLLESPFVTGQTIFVDGGRHMRGRVYG